jgi:CheY-like chemotaxis protein
MDWTPDILIVDDNQRMADSMEMLLGARGYTTRAVYDPHEALEPIASGTFGIVLLDLCMPGLTGFEVMDRVGDYRDQVEFIIIRFSMNLQQCCDRICHRPLL